MLVKNSVYWSAMIKGYDENGDATETLALFKTMVGEGVDVMDVSVLAALHACGEVGYLDEGKHVHKLLMRIELESNVSVMNALITMLSKCKRADLAAQLYDELRYKTRISWNAMILGHMQNGMSDDAVWLFSRMQLENVKPDSFTPVSVSPALADISDSTGKMDPWIHTLSALVDMYTKCGRVSIARSLFNSARERHGML